MSPRELDDHDQSRDFSDSGEDLLLRAIARAPSAVEARSLMAEVLPELATTMDTPARAEGHAPRPGDVIDGRYRIDETLGSGGMGVVFGATHTSTGRRVALKWMLAHGLHRTPAERLSASQRFVREAQATGRIKHPNVVDVYDAGVDPQAPYLVMERLEGETLRACVERGAMAWDDALSIMLPVMEGVLAAHRQGVVHRDLKPDNVFLARAPDGSVRPKVLDFGISRLRQAEAGEPSLTRTGVMIGTPAYMPLEQLRGVDIDERADVYALGVVLYELLTGARPHVARNAADFAALLAAGAPVPLSRHRPQLRGVREAAVMKALARDPGDRHAGVAEFMAALRRQQHARPRLSRRWLVLAAALAGLGGVSLLLVNAPRVPADARPSLPPAPAAPAPASDARVPAPAERPDEPLPPSAQPPAPGATAPAPFSRPRARRVQPAAPPPAEPSAARVRMDATDFAAPARGPSQAAGTSERKSPSAPPSLDLDRGQF